VSHLMAIAQQLWMTSKMVQLTPEGHNGTRLYTIHSVTTDGSNYYAACERAIHTGQIDTLTSDEVAINFSTSDRTDSFIKYAKGFVLFGCGNTAYNLTIVPKAYTVGGTDFRHALHQHTITLVVLIHLGQILKHTLTHLGFGTMLPHLLGPDLLVW